MKLKHKLQKRLKYALEKCPLTHSIMETKRLSKASRRIEAWENKEAPRPTEPVKHRNLKNLAEKHGLDTLIETGTYHGDTLYALRDAFKEIHSIELSEEYHAMVSYRLSGYSHIHLHLGNSGDIIPDVIHSLKSPALIWLDAHYGSYGDGGAAIGSEDCPIYKELSHIYENSNGLDHRIVIDDANIFEAQKSDYPSIEKVREFLISKGYASDLLHDREHDCLVVIN